MASEWQKIARALTYTYVIHAVLSIGQAQDAPAPAPVPAPSPSAGAGTVHMIDPWAPGVTYAPLTLAAGTNLTFVWAGLHGVYELNTDKCPSTFNAAAGTEVAKPVSSGSYSVILVTGGPFTYACPVADHCSLGQLVAVTVV